MFTMSVPESLLRMKAVLAALLLLFQLQPLVDRSWLAGGRFLQCYDVVLAGQQAEP